MKRLCDIIDCDITAPVGAPFDDTRRAERGGVFFAIKGDSVDGCNYAEKAVELGACAVVAQRSLDLGVPVIVVPDAARAMNSALNRYYNDPLGRLRLIGVTGTDGKTTLASVIYQLMNRHEKCGFIGTKIIECPGFRTEHHLTTPLPADLFPALEQLADRGCRHVVMEVSSQRLSTGRMEGVPFEAALFTNLFREHLDTHKTMENYAAAKARLFSAVDPDGCCVINTDDSWAGVMTAAASAEIIAYGAGDGADYRISDVSAAEDRLAFTLSAPQGVRRLRSPMPGAFNAFNITAAIALLTHMGGDFDELCDNAAELKHIEVRQDTIELGQPYRIFIDYAHTGNGLKNLIEYARAVSRGRVTVVLGTAGERFIGRKIDLGKVVVDMADHVIFTIENPRTEPPFELIEQMLTEADRTKGNFETIINRTTAIHRALDEAKPGDAVLITGKGANGNILVNGLDLPYPTDAEIVTRYLKKN